MITQRKTANAVGGMTARACESCLRRRARWYCSADEAFLCQSCDASVHSANLLAIRHERVRLETASCKPATDSGLENSEPSWHQGFTRKARTPRHPKSKPVLGKKEKIVNSFPLVPELGSEDGSLLLDEDEEEEEEEQLLYRVPVFDPYDAELCNMGTEFEDVHAYEIMESYVTHHVHEEDTCNLDDLHRFLPPDEMNLLETLFGTGLEDEACGMEGLGLLDCKEENDRGFFYDENKVKVEDDGEVEAILACNVDLGFDMTRETLDWNFDYESPVNGEDKAEEDQKLITLSEATTMIGSSESQEEMRNKITLNLNCEGVIAAWANQGSPWTTGIRPEFNPDYWPHFMGMGSVGMNRPYAGGGSDGGREARVLRYREKRRTRLFSKKIRYEVRKLNAEKRPRMKGRFVKQTSFATAGLSTSAAVSSFPNYIKKDNPVRQRIPI